MYKVSVRTKICNSVLFSANLEFLLLSYLWYCPNTLAKFETCTHLPQARKNSYAVSMFADITRIIKQVKLSHSGALTKVFTKKNVAPYNPTPLNVGMMVNAPLCNSLYFFLSFLFHPYIENFYYD